MKNKTVRAAQNKKKGRKRPSAAASTGSPAPTDSYTIPGTSYGPQAHPYPDPKKNNAQTDNPYLSAQAQKADHSHSPLTEEERVKLAAEKKRQDQIDRKQRILEKNKQKKLRRQQRAFFRLCILMAIGMILLGILSMAAAWLLRENSVPEKYTLVLYNLQAQKNDYFTKEWKIDPQSDSATAKISGAVSQSNGTVYFNLSRYAELFGLTVTGDREALRFINTNVENQNAIFYQNSTAALVNNVEVRLSHPVFFQNGEAYIPIEFFNRYVLGYSMTYDRAKQTMSLERRRTGNTTYAEFVYTLFEPLPEEHIAESSLPPDLLYQTDPYRQNND